MKIDIPQANPPVTDRAPVGQTPDPWQPTGMSFEDCLDTARDRREQRAAQAFEFLELGMFGAERDGTSPSVEVGVEPPALSQAPGAVAPRRPPAPPQGDPPSPPQRRQKTIPVSGAPSTVLVPTNPAQSSWASAIDSAALTALIASGARPRLAQMLAPSDAVPLAGRAQPTPGQRAPAAREPATESPGAARQRQTRNAEPQGAVRVTVQQSERGLVVQAFATGGVNDEVVARLRQRAHDLALEHGQTLADLTINGVRIAVAPNQRSR